MNRESALIAALRALATDPAARGLRDDAAVLPVARGAIVLTHDMLIEGVHFLPGDPPGDVAWKLLAVNMSDLAAKGADPMGVLLGYGMTSDAEWDLAFVTGLREAIAHFGVPLLGGDTVAQPAGDARALGLTAIGAAGPRTPSRTDARAGDALYVTGTIGDSRLGLRIASDEIHGSADLLSAYRRPVPRLAAGRALAPFVHAMADVSDGLLIDASRIAEASGLAVAIDLAVVPLSSSAKALAGDDRAARIAAATGGDDYELLFSAPADAQADLAARIAPLALTRIGSLHAGSGIVLTDAGRAVPLPSRLGYEH